VEDTNLPFSNSKFGHKREVRICPAIQPKDCSEFYPNLPFSNSKFGHKREVTNDIKFGRWKDKTISNNFYEDDLLQF